MAIIKLYVSDDEKARLKESATMNGMSLSAYILSRAKATSESCYIPPEDTHEKRDHVIYVRVSDSEYRHIAKLSSGRNISAYARKVMLSAGTPITISIITDDISAFDREMSEKMQYFQNVIEVLAYRSLLQPQESEKMLAILSEVRDDLKEMTHYVKNNRKSIRNAGLRWLKAKYKRSMEKSL